MRYKNKLKTILVNRLRVLKILRMVAIHKPVTLEDFKAVNIEYPDDCAFPVLRDPFRHNDCFIHPLNYPGEKTLIDCLQ